MGLASTPDAFPLVPVAPPRRFAMRALPSQRDDGLKTSSKGLDLGSTKEMNTKPGLGASEVDDRVSARVVLLDDVVRVLQLSRGRVDANAEQPFGFDHVHRRAHMTMGFVLSTVLKDLYRDDGGELPAERKRREVSVDQPIGPIR